LFSRHNFQTKNAGKPIKSSEDSDYSLVSNKNLSQKIISCGWGPGPDDLGQKCLNLPHIWKKKTKKQIPKFFKFFKIQTKGIAAQVWTALYLNHLASYGAAKWWSKSGSLWS